MGNSSKLVYAIRTGDFIELRRCTVPLKALVSKLTKTVVVKRGSYSYDPEFMYPVYSEKDENKKIILKQTFFVGGTVIGYTKATTFMRLLGSVIRKDKPLQITGSLADNILNPSWRRKNL